MKRRPNHQRTVLAGLVAALVLGLAACSGSEASAGRKLAADAPLPDKVPSGTVLRVGSPGTQVALEKSGLIDQVKGYKIEWANLSGGPESIEAFRAGALDLSSVADIPPLFATWTDTPVKIAAVSENPKPIENPTYQLGIAPGADVTELEDIEGKKVAYSPGQAQGALVLKLLQELGLSQDDVELVELQSVDDTYGNALASNQVDVAPLGGTLLASYLSKYGRDGATALRTGIRDDAGVLYGPVETFEDPGKAAAVKDFVQLWVKAQRWIDDHPDEYVKGFYVDHEGLSFEDGKKVLATSGADTIPSSWDDFIARHQETADLLAEAQGQPRIDVNDLYDRRYERVIATTTRK